MSPGARLRPVLVPGQRLSPRGGAGGGHGGLCPSVAPRVWFEAPGVGAAAGDGKGSLRRPGAAGPAKPFPSRARGPLGTPPRCGLAPARPRKGGRAPPAQPRAGGGCAASPVRSASPSFLLRRRAGFAPGLVLGLDPGLAPRSRLTRSPGPRTQRPRFCPRPRSGFGCRWVPVGAGGAELLTPVAHRSGRRVGGSAAPPGPVRPQRDVPAALLHPARPGRHRERWVSETLPASAPAQSPHVRPGISRDTAAPAAGTGQHGGLGAGAPAFPGLHPLPQGPARPRVSGSVSLQAGAEPG